MSENHIDSRIPVDTSVEPVDIKEDCYGVVEEVANISDQLNQLRVEIGRLFQVINNLKDKANTVELDMMNKRKALLDAHDIGDGQWVLDSANKQLVRVEKGAPLTP